MYITSLVLIYLITGSLCPLTVLHAVSQSCPTLMKFSRQECWSGLPFPPPGALSDPGLEPESHAYPALAGGVLTTLYITSLVFIYLITESLCPLTTFIQLPFSLHALLTTNLIFFYLFVEL